MLLPWRARFSPILLMLRLIILALAVVTATLAGAQQPAISIAPERLPDAVDGQLYYQQLEARGAVRPYRWKLAAGSLPAGITLDSTGLLTGIPRQPGEFTFTVQVTDAGTRSATRQYAFRVRAVLTIAWTKPPAVGNGGIFGELMVTNSTHESVDLTVIVLAVAENGRATALGYQHFALRPGQQAIPFGSTLPTGAYVVHADAIAEIARTRAIYRTRLQSPRLSVP